MKHSNTWLATLLFVLLGFSMAASASTAGTHTPAKGSEERKGILDAVRGVIRKMSGLEVVFVVRHLKVNKDWATSDKIRNELTAIGFENKDTKDGAEWKLNK